ncbi:MAG: type II toxin-antitoxin system VapC family toxin [Alphaproteobacteria bacterium]
MPATVFDASVILAAVLDEPGGEAVYDMTGRACISAVNVAEVYTYAAVNDLPTDALDGFFVKTGIIIIPFDEDQAVAAGGLAAVTRKAGLSLGDRSCLALALTQKAEVLTADRPWKEVAADSGVNIMLLR